MRQDFQQDIGKAGFLEKDLRFERLLGAAQWNTLPEAVRSRFGKRVRGGASVAYQGQVDRMKLSRLGWALAQVARLVGGPLPFDPSCVGKPAVVVVTEDLAGQGQFWIRQYGRAASFPQVVHSSKRFGGPTGLEEYIGYRLGIALNLQVADRELLFQSDHYFLVAFGRRFKIPAVFSPGHLTIGHKDLGAGRFRFSLALKHRVFGDLVTQDATFCDAS